MKTTPTARNRPPPDHHREREGPILHHPRRVGYATDCLHLGGACLSTIELAHGLARHGFPPAGIHVYDAAGPEHPEVASRAAAVAPVTRGPQQLAELLRRCDVFLHWGMTNVITGPQIVLLSRLGSPGGDPLTAGWPHADALAAVSEAAALSFPPAQRRRVLVLGEAIAPPAESTIDRETQRRLWRVPLEAPVLLQLGRISPEKRPHLLAATVALLPGWHAVLVGWGEPNYVALIERLGERDAPGRFHHVGKVTNSTPCYRAADLLLQASQYEGMSRTILEANAAGLPVATTPVGRYLGPELRHAALVLDDLEPAAIAAAIARARRGLPLLAEKAHIAMPSWEDSLRQWASLLRQISLGGQRCT